LEDYVDRLWAGRPQWARPAVGGVALGLLLLVLPQMYGVGYPVMNSVIAGHVVIGLVLLFLIGKIAATSLTLSIGGSGGVFAPSLFIGAMAGMAFGEGARAVFGASVGPPALYAVVAMGGVFAATAQAPLTAIASVVEMTGNFALTVPVMLTSAIAAAVSKRLSYGSVYTTKLLRRGIDIERARTTGVLHTRTVSEIMQPILGADEHARLLSAHERESEIANGVPPAVGRQIIRASEPQELFEDETLEQALRQLTLYGHAGLPVISQDREHVKGWVTTHAILEALARTIEASPDAIKRGATVADVGFDDPLAEAHRPTNPLHGYEILEISVDESSPAAGHRPDDFPWPPGAVIVAVHREGTGADADAVLRPGDRITLLSPMTGDHAAPELHATEPATRDSPA
jgi:CIC family chloride channel protein